MTQPFGTPNYMAPEVIKAYYNEKCDIWSIGILMYVLLIGKMPFKGRTDAELLGTISRFKNINLDIPELANRSIGCLDVLRKLLHVNPEHRPNAKMLGEHNWIRSLGAYTVTKSLIKRSL